MTKLPVCCYDHVSLLAPGVVCYYLTKVIIYFYESRSMHRSLFVACLLLLQTLYGVTPSHEAYYLDDAVMKYITAFYDSRGIDTTHLPSFYMQPDLCQRHGAFVTATYATYTNGKKVIFLSRDFNQKLTEQVYGKKVKASYSKTLLHEMGHHKQDESNGMLDAIRDKLDFEIDDIKYEEAAADVFAYKHMHRNEILTLNEPFEKIGAIRLMFAFFLGIRCVFGDKLFQKMLETASLTDNCHLNDIEGYKLRKFMAQQQCLSDSKQRISTRHHSNKKNRVKQRKKHEKNPFNYKNIFRY